MFNISTLRKTVRGLLQLKINQDIHFHLGSIYSLKPVVTLQFKP